MSVLVGKEAPDFTAQAVMADNAIKADFNLKKETKGKYTVLFFWPLDFTLCAHQKLLRSIIVFRNSKNLAQK